MPGWPGGVSIITWCAVGSHTREAAERRRESAWRHHVGDLLALCGVGGGDGIDDGLGLFLTDF